MRLTERFNWLQSRGEKALVLFVTAGDPDLARLPEILELCQEGGADVMEVGVPFSDPIADGPTIQASSQRALERGVTPVAVLETLARAKLEIPVVLMGYYNTMLRQGLDAFAKNSREAGASGVIVCDLTPEEAGDWRSVASANEVDTIFLAAPTSTEARLDAVAQASTGFVYAVSRTGVTGAATQASADAAGLVAKLKDRTQTPVCVGFGISRPEHVRQVCQTADGAVVGSWLVDRLKDYDGSQRAELLAEIRALKEATR